MAVMSKQWYDRLRERREELGMRPEDLARLVGFTRQGIIKLESGDTKNPGYRTIDAIARVLGVPASYLFDDSAIHEVLPFLSNPKEDVIRVAIDLVKPEDAAAFMEFTREWVTWPAAWREIILEMSRMVRFKEVKRSPPRVMGRAHEREESYSTEE